MRGKTVVITGATSGIGEVAARTLAAQGARVVFVARNQARGSATLDHLRGLDPSAGHDWVLGDLSTLSVIKAVAAELAAKAPRIDVLVNNAGAIFDRREITSDGLEKTFAVDHMAYFVLTEILRPNLVPGEARIVSTASVAHQFGRLDFDDLQSARKYSAFRAYGTAKLCNVLWTRELARRLDGTGVTANCLHPGGVGTGFGANTRGVLKSLMSLAKPLMLTSAQGADTLIWLATSPDVAGKTGGYWTKRRLAEPSRAGRDDAAAARLWSESALLAGPLETAEA